MAIALDVDTQRGTARNVVLPRGASASLIGSDALEVSVTDVERLTVGTLARVRMSVRLRRRLPTLRLTTATWPAIPAGTTGIVLIPFETFAVRDGGGVGVIGGGVSWASNRIAGFVQPSTDWRGEPFNFFDAGACRVGETLCSRFETFPAITSDGWSEPRRVGFELEPAVKAFRVHLVVAADLDTR